MNVFALSAATTLGVLLVVILTWNGLKAYQCSSYQEVTHKETQYRHFDACYVKKLHKWYHWEQAMNN